MADIHFFKPSLIKKEGQVYSVVSEQVKDIKIDPVRLVYCVSFLSQFVSCLAIVQFHVTLNRVGSFLSLISNRGGHTCLLSRLHHS